MTTFGLDRIFEDFDISGAVYTFITAVEAFMKNGKETLGKWVKRSRGRADLAKMNDRMLADIGLTRADVYQETGKHFWQK